MTTILTKLLAISMWCNGAVCPDTCRMNIHKCLQGKTTEIQIQSCFLGEKIHQHAGGGGRAI